MCRFLHDQVVRTGTRFGWNVVQNLAQLGAEEALITLIRSFLIHINIDTPASSNQRGLGRFSRRLYLAPLIDALYRVCGKIETGSVMGNGVRFTELLWGFSTWTNSRQHGHLPVFRQLGLFPGCSDLGSMQQRQGRTADHFRYSDLSLPIQCRLVNWGRRILRRSGLNTSS